VEAAVHSLVVLIQRRRRLVLGLWMAAVLIAAPLAAKQSTHLTGGGFNVPGSQSLAVQQQLQRFGTGATVAAVLVPQRGAGAPELRRAIDGVAREARTIPELRLARGALGAAAGRAAAAPGTAVIVPMTAVSGNDRAIDIAQTLRTRFGIDEKHAGRLGAVDVYLVGQGPLWAAVQESTKTNAQ